MLDSVTRWHDSNPGTYSINVFSSEIRIPWTYLLVVRIFALNMFCQYTKLKNNYIKNIYMRKYATKIYLQSLIFILQNYKCLCPAGKPERATAIKNLAQSRRHENGF